MKLVSYRGKTLQVPEQLEELTPAQYRRYLEIHLMAGRGLISRPGLRVKLLTLLLGEQTDLSMMEAYRLQEAMKHIDLVEPFILEGERHDTLHLDTCTNLLKEWKGWKGPGDMLDGVTFGDFIDCESLLKLISKEVSAGHREALTTEFVRKLYRNEQNPSEEPDELLCAHTLLFFNNVVRALHQPEPIDINGEPISFHILFEKSKKQKPDDHIGWTGAAMDIAETGTFGTYREVRDTPLWEILIYLYRKKFERKYS